MSRDDRPASNRVQSIERAAALLRAVAASGAVDGTVAALADTVGLNRTTTWRMLATLEQERLVTRDDVSGTYSLGFGLIDLAGQAGGAALARAAQAVLQGLAEKVGETAALAVVREGVLTYVAEATGGAVVAAAWRDRPVPMHATSTGKVLLAWSEPDRVRTLLALPSGDVLPRHTDRTITSLAELEDELAQTRGRGYAVCRGEFESTAWGVSAPVLDVSGRPVAVVSVWGPGDRLTEDRFEPVGLLAVAAADEIAGRRAEAHAAPSRDRPRTAPAPPAHHGRKRP